MVSQRQRLARKKYREEHPELFPIAEPTPPKDPDKKKKKKKSKFKRKKEESNSTRDPNKPHKKGFKKHPLRVPGMKPGESCFICKAKDHIAKLCPEKAQWEKNKVCSVLPFLFLAFHCSLSLWRFCSDNRVLFSKLLLQGMWNLRIGFSSPLLGKLLNLVLPMLRLLPSTIVTLKLIVRGIGARVTWIIWKSSVMIIFWESGRIEFKVFL